MKAPKPEFLSPKKVAVESSNDANEEVKRRIQPKRPAPKEIVENRIELFLDRF